MLSGRPQCAYSIGVVPVSTSRTAQSSLLENLRGLDTTGHTSGVEEVAEMSRNVSGLGAQPFLGASVAPRSASGRRRNWRAQGDFEGKQNSLHALVVERESSQEGFPYLLGTQRLGGAVVVEDLDRVGERGP